MKVGDVISIGLDTRFRQILEVKQGYFVNTFVLQSIIDPDQIIDVEGHNLISENFKVRTREQTYVWLDWVEGYYEANGWEVTWNKQEVLNKLYGEVK